MAFIKLILSVILLIFVSIYQWFRASLSTYVKSSVDNKYYLVRDLPDKQQVADNLAYIKKNILTMVSYMSKNSPDKFKPYVERLNKKINNVIILENVRDFYYTSYSVNKGEQLVFCMRSRKDGSKDQKHSVNLMMYVVLHEIAHIACPEYGHGQLFKDIFKHFTETAIHLDLYEQIDFRSNPTEYCGMTIYDSIV
jgi:hypothetical protein